MMKNICLSRDKAVTLVELVMVAVIFSLCAAIILPRMSNMIHNRTLQAEAERLKSYIYQVQQQAIAAQVEKNSTDTYYLKFTNLDKYSVIFDTQDEYIQIIFRQRTETELEGEEDKIDVDLEFNLRSDTNNIYISNRTSAIRSILGGSYKLYFDMWGRPCKRASGTRTPLTENLDVVLQDPLNNDNTITVRVIAYTGRVEIIEP